MTLSFMEQHIIGCCNVILYFDWKLISVVITIGTITISQSSLVEIEFKLTS